jgi:hypothetical protein
MQKPQMLLARIAQAQANIGNHRHKKIKDRTSYTRRLELNRDSEVSPPYSFIACVAASTLITTFGLFCFTVRTFPGGGIRIEGPGGMRVEAELGTSTLLEETLTPRDRK